MFIDLGIHFSGKYIYLSFKEIVFNFISKLYDRRLLFTQQYGALQPIKFLFKHRYLFTICDARILQLYIIILWSIISLLFF